MKPTKRRAKLQTRIKDYLKTIELLRHSSQRISGFHCPGSNKK